MLQALQIKRAPVLTLWAAVVAERVGYRLDEALTLGYAAALPTVPGAVPGAVPSSGFRVPRRPDSELGAPNAELAGEHVLRLCGREVRALQTPQGWRGMSNGEPLQPEQVQRYLDRRFNGQLTEAREALETLAHACRPQDLETHAHRLYDRFRPRLPAGPHEPGAAGALDLALIRRMARERHRGGLRSRAAAGPVRQGRRPSRHRTRLAAPRAAVRRGR